MKTEDVEELLRGVIRDNLSKTCWTVSAEHLTELVNRAVKAEREARAKVCEENGNMFGDSALIGVCRTNAKRIRARGEA